MIQVLFLYNGKNIFIESNPNEKMKDIFEKFVQKEQIEKNSVYYLYQGIQIDDELMIDG